MMKFTTPATASAPYVADALPVSTSMCETSEGGILFRSAAVGPIVVGSPGMSLRPLIRTSVRCGPSPRRSIFATPEEPCARLELWSGVTCGSVFSRSTMFVEPLLRIASDCTTVTGLTLSSCGTAMREPVTTISSIEVALGGAGCCCAKVAEVTAQQKMRAASRAAP